jgi:hypothetical protein
VSCFVHYEEPIETMGMGAKVEGLAFRSTVLRSPLVWFNLALGRQFLLSRDII